MLSICRIEREQEEKRLRERQELLSQLEELQTSKQAEYQQEIQRLAKAMVGVVLVVMTITWMISNRVIGTLLACTYVCRKRRVNYFTSSWRLKRQPSNAWKNCYAATRHWRRRL